MSQRGARAKSKNTMREGGLGTQAAQMIKGKNKFSVLHDLNQASNKDRRGLVIKVA